jgi:RND family efflux transporter MFP subunit
MSDANPDPEDDRRRRLWTALGGTGMFILLGLVLLPDLVGRKPAPETKPSSRANRLERAPWANEDAAAVDRAPELRAAAPSSDADPDGRAFDCMIGPNEIVDVGSAITGVIDEVLVERSDYVEADQVLAKLEAEVEEAAVRVARARAERTVDIRAGEAGLDLDEKRQARAQELFDKDVLSLDVRQQVEAETTLAALELERAREDHRLASLQLEQAEAALERRTIRSPVSGFVVERLLVPGEVVDRETVIRIAQVDPLRVEAILPTDWFGRMHPGDRAEIVPEGAGAAPQVAQVELVDPVIDGASGTFVVHLLLANPDRALPAGLRCQVRFLGGSRERVEIGSNRPDATLDPSN